jgi:hypothetical protein
MAKSEIQNRLDVIGDDILNTLHESTEPLTQSEIFDQRGEAFKNTSEFGYSFAIEKLANTKKIEFVTPNKWEVNHG